MQRSARRWALTLGFLISGGAFAESPPNAFINGGSSVSSNFADQEQEALVFYHALFEQKATVLNAGDSAEVVEAGNTIRGAVRTPVVERDKEGLLRRDESGRIELTPSALTVPTRSATLSGIERLFATWKKEKPPAVTLGYGDHGDPHGIGLWSGTQLGPKQIRKLHAELPDGTWIRSIHSHCYAGASLVDPERETPRKLEDWKAYLYRHYRARSCGLALGNEKELSYSLTEGNWKDSPWVTHFGELRKEKQLNLTAMKARLSADKKVTSQVRLTSDYLVDDIFSFLCRSGYFHPAQVKRKESKDHGGAQAMSQRSESNPCHEPEAQAKADAANEALAKETAFFVELMEIRNEVAKRVLSTPQEPGSDQNRNLADYARLRELTKEHEALVAFFLVRRDSMPKHELEAFEKKMIKISKELSEYEVEVLAVSEGLRRNDEFEAVWKSASFRKWLRSPEQKREFPAFRERWDAPDNGEIRRTRFLDIYYEQAGSLYEWQAMAKKQNVGRGESRRRAVESVLNRSDFSELKKTYDSILECENNSLD